MTKDTFPMNIGGEKVRSERMLLAKVEDGKNMVSIRSTPYCISQNNVVSLHGGIIILILKQEYEV